MKRITSAASVLPDGKELENDGSAERPFRTINRAAEIAEPGTRIIVAGEIRRCPGETIYRVSNRGELE